MSMTGAFEEGADSGALDSTFLLVRISLMGSMAVTEVLPKETKRKIREE
jgi:hypothetical protein